MTDKMRLKIQALRDAHACLMSNNSKRQRELIRKVLPDLIERGFCKLAHDMTQIPDNDEKSI